MRVEDWLLDISENYYWDILDDEVCILPIIEEDDEE